MDCRELSSRWKSGLVGVLGVAVAVRLLVFPFAENKQADAPIRALLAEQMNVDERAALDPRTFCQFGALPIGLIRPFLLVGADPRVASRVPFLLAGLAAFVPFLGLAWRMTGDRRAVALAGLALALSSLHVQLSVTAASEAVYLLFLLACLERMHRAVSSGRRGDYAAAGAFAALAAVSRYDAWLSVPAAAAALLLWRPRHRRVTSTAIDVATFVAVAASLPAVYLAWHWLAGSDPFSFARTIAREHATAAMSLRGRLGGVGARAHQLAVWTVSFASAMTPVAFAALPAAFRRRREWPPATRAAVTAALAPTLAYLARGLLGDGFEALPRFALVPGVVLLPLAARALLRQFPSRGRRTAVVAAAAVGFAAWALVAAHARPGRSSSILESLAPITRLDDEDRAVAAYLRKHRRPGETIFVDTYGFADIVIAHAALVPLPRVATLANTRLLRDTVAAARSRTQASLFAAHDRSWGTRPLRDWPAGSLRFGEWRVARVDLEHPSHHCDVSVSER